MHFNTSIIDFLKEESLVTIKRNVLHRSKLPAFYEKYRGWSIDKNIVPLGKQDFYNGLQTLGIIKRSSPSQSDQYT